MCLYLYPKANDRGRLGGILLMRGDITAQWLKAGRGPRPPTRQQKALSRTAIAFLFEALWPSDLTNVNLSFLI